MKHLYKVYVQYINTANCCDNSTLLIRAYTEEDAKQYAIETISRHAKYVGDAWAMEAAILEAP